MHRCLLLLPLIFTLCSEVKGQFDNYKKFEYRWDSIFPKAVPIEPSFQDESLVILNEENYYKVSGVKSYFMKIYIEKKMHIKYLNAEELSAGAHFELPESFDPKLDRIDVPRNSTYTAQRPKLFDVKVLFFAARIKKPDGKIIEAQINDEMVLDDRSFQLKSHRSQGYSFSSQRVRLENNNSYTYIFQIQNLERGDELEVHYKYEIPYEQNWYLFNSKRVFYHGNYAKQAYSFTFDFKKMVGTKFLYNNGAAPANKSDDGEHVRYVFKEKNLPRCINEINARPHLELPFFVYTLNPLDARYYYQSPYRIESAPLPFWLYLLKLREQYTQYQLRRVDPLVKDKQWRLVQKFMINTTAQIPPSKVFSKLNILHNTVVNDFDYQKDGAFFAGKDSKLERLGTFTENKTLREISRFKLYVKFLNYLHIAYNTVYFVDKRVAQMGAGYISPIIDNEYGFIVPMEDRVFYVYPKKGRSGYYGDELPFYWENEPALSIEFLNLWGEKIADLNFVKTHARNAKDNIRVCNVKTTVDLNAKQLNCQAKVSLSGQFSTMTRNVYAYNQIDSTLNPIYGQRINFAFQGADSTKLSPTSKNLEYPFKTNFSLEYGSSEMVNQVGKNYEIDLKDWFPHVVERELQDDNRVLAYYPDFRSQDIMKYFFVFADTVTLLNKASLDVRVSNSYGTYTVIADQLNPTTIMLSSDFKVNAEYVLSDNIGDVVGINTAILKLNRGRLIVTKARGASQ